MSERSVTYAWRHRRILACFLLIQTAYTSCTPSLAFWFFKKHKHSDNQVQDESAPLVTPNNQSPSFNPPRQYLPAPVLQEDIKRTTINTPRSSQIERQTNCPLSISADSHLIRVALALNSKIADIYTTAKTRVISAADGQTVARLPGQSHWQISCDSQTIVLQMRQSVTAIAQGKEKYIEAYHSELPAVHSGNFRPGLSADGRSHYPVYLPAYAPTDVDKGSVQSAAYFPTASSASQNQSRLNNCLRLPIKASFVSASASLLNPGGEVSSTKGPIGAGSVPQSGSYFLVVDNKETESTGAGNLPLQITCNGKSYKGCLCLSAVAQSSSFNLINYLDIEDYLLSVVPSEMPSSWTYEALKAQAIAARSYALANLGKHAKDGYDVKDTTEDQVYSGIKSEAPTSNQAVIATRGLVLTYQGKPICAYFHSTSGGSTELAENVWSKPLPYLKSVAGFDQLSPHYSWSRKFSIDELESNIVPEAGKLLSILVIARTPTQRATYLLLISSSGARILPAETVRRALNLPSNNFNVTPCDQAYSFTGHGFGHGLGLSQWGAKALAEQGYNAEQILKYYYKDVNVERPSDVFGS